MTKDHIDGFNAGFKPLKGPIMVKKLLVTQAIASAVLLFGVTQAHANTINLNLFGKVSDATTGSWTSGDTQYDAWWLSLTGFDASNPVSVGVGDTINATVTLDQSITVPTPPASYLSWVQLNLSGESFPSFDTATTGGSAAFFNNGVAGLTGSTNCSTSESLASCALFSGADRSSLTFDTMTMSYTVGTLGDYLPGGQSVNLDQGEISYTVFTTAVPEPETFAMMLAGLGLMGFITKRRKT